MHTTLERALIHTSALDAWWHIANVQGQTCHF